MARDRVRVKVTVRVSVSCAFSEAFIATAADEIAACTPVLRPNGRIYVRKNSPIRRNFVTSYVLNSSVGCNAWRQQHSSA